MEQAKNLLAVSASMHKYNVHTTEQNFSVHRTELSLVDYHALLWYDKTHTFYITSDYDMIKKKALTLDMMSL